MAKKTSEHVSAHANIKVTNMVYEDEIWKQHVAKEVKVAKQFPSNWGFVCDHYKETEEKFLESREQESTKKKLKIPNGIVPRPLTPLETYIKIGESPSYPKTASGHIGYRSAKKDCNLETFGRIARPSGSLYKQLGWPIEGCNM